MKEKYTLEVRLIEFVLTKFKEANDKEDAYCTLIRQIMNLDKETSRKDIIGNLLVILLHEYRQYEERQQEKSVSLKELEDGEKKIVISQLKQVL
jgi:hypothetical protein